MIGLTNPATGHKVSTDKESVDFWAAAGYRADEPKPVAKKAAAKRSDTKGDARG